MSICISKSANRDICAFVYRFAHLRLESFSAFIRLSWMTSRLSFTKNSAQTLHVKRGKKHSDELLIENLPLARLHTSINQCGWLFQELDNATVVPDLLVCETRGYEFVLRI